MTSDAAKWLKALSIFVAVNALAAAAYLALADRLFAWNPASSEAHLYGIPKNSRTDLVFMGASHGRVFSSFGNHAGIEAALGRSILNLSKTGAGPVPEALYLEYFYRRGNAADRIVYFFDPFVLFADEWNEQAHVLEDEPFRFSFFALSLQSGLDADVLVNYIRSKFTPYWISSRRSRAEDVAVTRLSSVDPTAVEKRLATLYPDGAELKKNESSITALRKIARMARDHGASLTIVVTPTLLGPAPGTSASMEAIEEIRTEFPLEFFDFSGTLHEPALYMDHDHLNREGIALFTERYLRPLRL